MNPWNLQAIPLKLTLKMDGYLKSWKLFLAFKLLETCCFRFITKEVGMGHFFFFSLCIWRPVEII